MNNNVDIKSDLAPQYKNELIGLYEDHIDIIFNLDEFRPYDQECFDNLLNRLLELDPNNKLAHKISQYLKKAAEDSKRCEEEWEARRASPDYVSPSPDSYTGYSNTGIGYFNNGENK